MKYINMKANKLQQCEIRRMDDKAIGLENVINLGIGEPDMTTPKEICDAAYLGLREGHTHYTPNEGTLECREAISNIHSIKNLNYNPKSEICITTGGMGALALCLQVILDPGDEVLIQDPQWSNYVPQVEYADGIAVRVPTYGNENFVLKSTEIEKRISKKTKAIIINSHNNPTGLILSKEELENIANLAKKYDLLFISDEVYNTITYGRDIFSIASIEGMRERTVIINSFSKSFAMTGWRIGYATGPKEIINKMAELQENFNACPTSISQYAAIYALTRLDLSEEMTKTYEKRRNIIVEGLNKIEGIKCIWPQGAFYVFPDISSFGLSSLEFCEKLLEEERVICTPGSAFGKCGEGYIRISYANSEKNLEKALERINNFTKKL